MGFLPEGELFSRSQDAAPYDMGHDGRKYPFGPSFVTAELASGVRADAVPALPKAFQDSDSAVRYRATLGVLMRGNEAVAVAHDDLIAALQDRFRIAAAEALGQCGNEADLKRA